MKALGSLIFSHWPLKLAALLLATVLWFGLTLSESTRDWTGPVPIEVLNAPDGGALLEDPGVVELIEFRAPDDIADALTNDSFRASIDLSQVVPRAGARPVNVPIDVFPVDPRVRVVSYSPTGVAVRVDEVVDLTLPVQIDSGPLPEGIELGPVIVEPNQVTVSGASSRVGNVRTVEGRFVVDASGINIDEDVTVEALDSFGAIVPGLAIDPARVRVTADAGKQLSYASLPVRVSLVGQPELGLRIGRISVVPSAVTIAGENPRVNRLVNVRTEPIDIEGATSEIVADVSLVLPDETTTPGVDDVRVIVTFVDDVGSRGIDVATVLEGEQPDLTYSLAEATVSVVVSGPLDRLEELGPADVVARIPVADLEVGDNVVMPIVDIPRGISLVRVSPRTVLVTVDAPS